MGHWFEDAQRYANESARMMLVGCKSDQQSKREVNYDEGRRRADALGMPFAEASSVTGAGVEAVFTTMVREIRKGTSAPVRGSSFLLEHLPKAAARPECARGPSASSQQSAGAMVMKGSYEAVLPAVQALCGAREDARMQFEEAMGKRLFSADGSEHAGGRAHDVSQATRALVSCARASLAGATALWEWDDMKRMMEDVNMTESAAAAAEISLMNERHRGEASTNAACSWQAACSASAPFRLARMMTLAMLQKGAKKDPNSAWAALILDDFSIAPSMDAGEKSGGCVLCHSKKKPIRALFTEKDKNTRYPTCGECMGVAVSCNALRTLKTQLARYHRAPATAANLAQGIVANMSALWAAFVSGKNQVKTFRPITLGESMRHVAAECLFVPPGDPLFRGGAPAEALGDDAVLALDSDDELAAAMEGLDSDGDEQLHSDEEENAFTDAVTQLMSVDTIDCFDSDGDDDDIEEFDSDDDEIMADAIEAPADECDGSVVEQPDSDSEGALDSDSEDAIVSFDEHSLVEDALDSDDEDALVVGKRAQKQRAGEGPPLKRR